MDYFSGRAPVHIDLKPVSQLSAMHVQLTVYIPMFVDIDDVTIPDDPSPDEWVLDKESRYLKWTVSYCFVHLKYVFHSCNNEKLFILHQYYNI